MNEVNRRAALSFVRLISVAELVALVSLFVTWIYFFSIDSRRIIFWTLLHGLAVFTSITGFYLVNLGSRSAVQLYIIVQALNMASSAIAIAIFGTIFSDCDSHIFCSSGPFGRKLTSYFIIVAIWFTVTSVSGLAGAMISLGFIPKGDRLLPTVKETNEKVRRTLKALKA